MGLPKGIRTVEWLRIRAKDQRGGKERKPLLFSRDAPDALVTWSETWMESLRARNYADGSVTGLFRSMVFFMKWAAERDITRAGEVTRPILETYQRWLWRYQRQGPGRGQGKPLSWSTQYKHLCCLKEWFRWLTRQNVIIHNPASELEMPRMEKRLPTEALKYGEVEQLLAVPDTSDPLGVRDRAMLELFYAIRYIQQLLGHENLETTALYAEVTIQQLIEVHARCHPAGKLENAASVATENPAT